MSANRFKLKMDKEKAKEIVSHTPVVEENKIETVADLTDTSTENTSLKVNEDEVVYDEEENTIEDTNSDQLKNLFSDIIIPYKKLGVSIKEDRKRKVEKIAKKYKAKPNTAVIKLLETIYDGKKFDVSFEKKQPLRVTSYNLPEDMVKAIEKISETTGVNKSEIFNTLLETALEKNTL